MADEMDKPVGADASKTNPDKTKAEGINASTTWGAENAVPVVEAVAETVEGLAAGDSVDDAATSAQTSAEVEIEPSAEVLSSHSGGAPSPSEHQRESKRPQTAAAGVPPGAHGFSRVEGVELDKPGLELLYDVELDATLQFGSKEMLLRDVLELGPGDVVELDRHIAQPVELVVGDRIVARGEVVVASGNFALRVTEVATPQMRLESIRCLF